MKEANKFDKFVKFLELKGIKLSDYQLQYAKSILDNKDKMWYFPRRNCKLSVINLINDFNEKL